MSEDYAQLLRDKGLRVTAARLAVLATIDQGEHMDADQIRLSVRERLGAISGQAIYDALNALTNVHVLRRVAPAGQRARYELNRGDNHHHAVCSGCGVMVDVECPVGKAPCIEPGAEVAGWRIEQSEVVYWGTCPKCLRSQAAEQDRDQRSA